MKQQGFIVGFYLLLALTSCATKERIVYERVHHYSQADTAATQVQADSYSHADHELTDSLVQATKSQWMHDFMAQSQEREVTTETLTETIDSLGRVIRQQQRTTERTLSRQELERRKAIEQKMMQEIARRISSYDSAWEQRFTRIQAHYEGIADAQSEEQVKPKQQPWWQQLLGKLHFAVIVILLAVSMYVTRRWWTKLMHNLTKTTK